MFLCHLGVKSLTLNKESLLFITEHCMLSKDRKEHVPVRLFNLPAKLMRNEKYQGVPSMIGRNKRSHDLKLELPIKLKSGSINIFLTEARGCSLKHKLKQFPRILLSALNFLRECDDIRECRMTYGGDLISKATEKKYIGQVGILQSEDS